MEQWTRQTAFNKVWNDYLVKKVPPGVDVLGNPVYVSEDGKKCGIGRLLSAKSIRHLKAYPKDQEQDVSGLVSIPSVMEDLLGVIEPTMKFLTELQECHDDSVSESERSTVHTINRIDRNHFRTALRIKLEDLAFKYNLVTP